MISAMNSISVSVIFPSRVTAIMFAEFKLSFITAKVVYIIVSASLFYSISGLNVGWHWHHFDLNLVDLENLLIYFRQGDQRVWPLTLGKMWNIRWDIESTPDNSIIRLLTCAFVVRKHWTWLVVLDLWFFMFIGRWIMTVWSQVTVGWSQWISHKQVCIIRLPWYGISEIAAYQDEQ